MRKTDKSICVWIRPEELASLDRALSLHHLSTGEKLSRQAFLRERVREFISQTAPPPTQ